MSTDFNNKIASLEQSIRDISMALEIYEHQINKNNAIIMGDNRDRDITAFLTATHTLLDILKDRLVSIDPADKQYVLISLLPELKYRIESMDELVREKCLPTQLHKIYEAIKTLLINLITLFIPLDKTTQTLTNARSTLFYQIKNLKKSLNSPITESQTEAPMIGLPQQRF